MKLMYLAAGLGTRLRPVTNRWCKPAVAFLNVPLLKFSHALLEPLKAKSIVINAHHRPEQVEALAAELRQMGSTVSLSLESEKPLGSGGGVWAARAHLKSESTFFVANADEVILPSDATTILKMLEQHESHDALATLLVMSHPEAGGRFGAVWANDDGKVCGFGRNGKMKPWHYVGVIALSRRIFEFLPNGESNLLYDALLKAIDEGERVDIFIDQCVWWETGNSSDFLQATQQALSLLDGRHEFLTSVVSRFSQGSKLFSGSHQQRALLAPEFFDFDLSDISGFAVIGAEAKLPKKLQIQDSVILPQANLRNAEKILSQICF